MDHAQKFAACRMGCGHCCYVSVPITDFEARYIGEKINTAPAPVKHSIRRNLTEVSGKTPCIFLKDNACSIYEFRPLTCRIHMNFDIDNYWCLHENWSHPDAAPPIAPPSPISFWEGIGPIPACPPPLKGLWRAVMPVPTS
jgi:Fe-S-cluster containining protein